MGKDDILHLLDIATDEEKDFEIDDMDENEISNPAHKSTHTERYEPSSVFQ